MGRRAATAGKDLTNLMMHTSLLLTHSHFSLCLPSALSAALLQQLCTDTWVRALKVALQGGRGSDATREKAAVVLQKLSKLK